VNKFRGKYAVNLDESSEAERDRVINAEVAKFLLEEPMTEANLLKLDKRFSDIFQNKAASRGGNAGRSPA
jgi:hypothetical protein